MKILVFIILAIIVAAMLLKLRAPSRKPGKAPRVSVTNRVPAPGDDNPALDDPYRAVSIAFGAEACEAVQSIGSKRFLVGETPRVPLPACTASTCSCKYKHHDDRRDSDAERRHPAAMTTQMYGTDGKAERREKEVGRRESDWE